MVTIGHATRAVRIAGTAAVAATVMGVVLGTAGPASAMCVDPSDGTSVPCPTRSGHDYAPPVTVPAQSVTDNSEWTLQWMLLAAAVLAGLAILAVAGDVLHRRRWRQPELHTALAASNPDDLPRAAGLLGERLAQHSRAGAAEHAYRAAIDVGDEYWTPIAQVALANLLNERGERDEAQALLEAVITSGHPRAVPAAQTSLDRRMTGKIHAGTPFETYDSHKDTAAAYR